MDLNYTPIHETTRRFHLSNAYARWLMGPVGCGKSYAVCWEILIRASQQPLSARGRRRSRVIFVRNSRQQLIDSVLPILREVFPEPQLGTWVSSTSTYQVRVGDIECDILLRPLEDDSDIKRVLSINATFCVFDEWREIPVSTVVQVAARAGRFPAKNEEGCTYAGVFGASNPPIIDSDWYTQLEEAQPANWEVYKFPSALSDEATWRQFLRPTYYEDLMTGATEDFIRVMVRGEYGRSLGGRPVYENSFVEAFHVAKEPLAYIRDENRPVIIGLDFGRTPSAVIGQRDVRNRILVLAEVDAENMGIERFLRDKLRPFLYERYPGMPFRVVADPAGWQKSQINEKSPADVMKDNGLPAVRASTNDPERRIAAVERALMYQIDGKAMFLIDPGCRKLIRAFGGGYKYKRKTDGTYEPKPLKDSASHLSDACQYFVLGVDGDATAHQQRRREITQVSAAAWT